MSDLMGKDVTLFHHAAAGADAIAADLAVIATALRTTRSSHT